MNRITNQWKLFKNLHLFEISNKDKMVIIIVYHIFKKITKDMEDI